MTVKEKLERLLREEKESPTLPEVGIQAMQIALDDSLAQKKLVQLVMRYPDIASRVIHLANSPLFGLSGRISSIERAVNLLGIAPIRSLVLSLSILIAMSKQKREILGPIFRKIQDDSFACGIAAKLIAETAGYPQPDEAFLAGLLYHIGYFFILPQLEDAEHFRLIEHHLENPFGEEIEVKEKEVFGYAHTELGGLIGEQWFLPSHINAVIKSHHEDYLDSIGQRDARKLVRIVQGSLLLNHIFNQGERNGNGIKLVRFVEKHLGIPGHACDKVLLEFSERLAEESNIFKLPVKPRKNYLNILRESNRKLYEISLEYLRTLDEKKKLAEENRKFTEVLDAIFAHSPDIIVALDGQGKLLMINDSIEKLIGVPAEEFLSGRQNILDYYPAGLANKIMEVLKSNQYGPPGVIVDYEAFIIDRKGQKVSVSISGTLIQKSGEVKMSIVFLRDIRKRKTIQQELLNARKYLDLIFNTITDGIRVIDSSMTIEYENKKLVEIWGKGIGKKCYETHIRAGEKRKKPCEECPIFPFAPDKTATHEVTGKDGRTFLVSSTSLDIEGKPPSVVQIIKDISLFKEQERIKADQQKLKAIMELAGATAHELNQPLTAIMMGIELVSRQLQQRRVVPEEVINEIIGNVEKMGGIISRLSKITRYETRDYLKTMKILDLDGSSKEES